MFGEDDVARIKALTECRALVIGEEICPTTGKLHFQGYVRFGSNKRFSWWKNQFPSVHVEVRKGTEVEASEYCRKGRKLLVDYGCQVDVPKTGSDEVHVLDLLEAGAPLYQIYRAHRVFFFRNSKRITDLEALMVSWRQCGYVFEKE